MDIRSTVRDCHFYYRMKKIIFSVLAVLLLTGCAQEFNAVYKHSDYFYKYEYAKQCYVAGKYTQASTLFGEIITMMKGTDHAEESLFLYAMSLYLNGEYDLASDAFKRCYVSYPKGQYTERAYFYTGESLYESSPEPRLDQSPTMAAIKAYQDFLDIFPRTSLREKAQERMIALQDKLVQKEYYNARLYYHLGTYFGNCLSGGSNYEACIITSQNAINDYPYMKLREEFAVLIMKSKFYLAENSVEAKRYERYQSAEDECYGFINEYPDSKERDLAERFITECKKHTQQNINSGI